MSEIISGSLGSSPTELVSKLAENRSDPAVKTRHSGHISVNKQAGTEQPWRL